MVQLGKRLGLKVIGSVGSDEKVKLVKDLGADHVFNYKTSSYMEELKKHGPIDVCIDHVGGECLEAVIENANQKCRILIIGAISTYNANWKESYGVRVSVRIFELLELSDKRPLELMVPKSQTHQVCRCRTVISAMLTVP